MTSRSWPAMLPVRSVRFARPADQLGEVVRFYREGLGLPELDRFAGHAGLACPPTSPPRPMFTATRRCPMRVTVTTCWLIRSTWFWGLRGWPRDALMSRKKKGRWLASPPGSKPVASSNWKTCS